MAEYWDSEHSGVHLYCMCTVYDTFVPQVGEVMIIQVNLHVVLRRTVSSDINFTVSTT